MGFRRPGRLGASKFVHRLRISAEGLEATARRHRAIQQLVPQRKILPGSTRPWRGVGRRFSCSEIATIASCEPSAYEDASLMLGRLPRQRKTRREHSILCVLSIASLSPPRSKKRDASRSCLPGLQLRELSSAAPRRGRADRRIIRDRPSGSSPIDSALDTPPTWGIHQPATGHHTVRAHQRPTTASKPQRRG